MRCIRARGVRDSVGRGEGWFFKHALVNCEDVALRARFVLVYVMYA